MNQRIFGATGWRIGEIGLGCWQLGGSDWGDLPEERALAILQTAVESGINFFDTADVYGDGRSETLIGRFLRETRAPVRVATKLGRRGLYPDKYTEIALRQATEASLRRLGVDTLDLTQLHCVPTEVLRRGEVFEWLRRQQRDGLICHFGASVESIEQARLCCEQPGLVSLQIIFNIFRQEAVNELLPLAKNRSIAIIARLPLASGLLSGKLTANRQFPANDHRHYNRDGRYFNVGETFAGLPFAIGVALTEELRPLLPAALTMSQMALRWILDHPEISVVIPGASTPAQVTENAAAAELPALGPELHERLATFYRERVAGQIRGPR